MLVSKLCVMYDLPPPTMMWELETPSKNHWKKFLHKVIDDFWSKIMVTRLENLKILRFIGEGDLKYRDTPEIMKYAETAKEIDGQRAQIKLLCGEYMIGENTYRIKTTTDDKCTICRHYFGKEIKENVEHFLFRCPKLQEDDRVKKAETELRGVYSELLQHSTDFGGRTSLLEEIYDEKYLTDRAQFVLNPYSNQLNWYWRIVNLNKSDAKKIIKAHTLYIFRVHSRYHYVKNVIETENGKPPRPGATSAIKQTKTIRTKKRLKWGMLRKWNVCHHRHLSLMICKMRIAVAI